VIKELQESLQLYLDQYTIASFSGRSHLQSFITNSMQIQRGKAWEIWSRGDVM